MVRPRRERWIGCHPRAKLYKPAGVPASTLRVATLDLDELEAMRLVDGEGLRQSEASEHMRISRSSVGRLLESGRAKVVKAFMNGDGLEIQEGEAPLHYHPQAGRARRGGRHRKRMRVDELSALKGEAKYLGDALQNVERRIEQLESKD